jgi:hypothetical protein
MVAWARARREGCGSWRIPAAGWNAGRPEDARERSSTTEERLGDPQGLLDQACTGRDQARRERFAGRQAHERPAPRLPGRSAR